MKKTIAILMAIALCLCTLAGCFTGPKPEAKKSRFQINPDEDAASKEKVTVMLYFGYNDEFMLAAEPRVIEMPVNGRLETAALKALIEGPSANNQSLKPLLDPSIQVQSVSDSGEYLFVTFNNELLKQARASTTAEAKKKMRLATYSIVNTLVELGGYSSVQLNVDADGNGLGQRIQKSVLGFEGTGDLEPQGMNNAIVLNPRNTVSEFLNAYANKDFERMYSFIANRDINGTKKPTEDDFLSGVVSFNSGIKDSNVIDYYMSADAKTAVVMVNFRVETKDGGDLPENNVPIRLTCENNIWRISYDSFLKIFKSNL